MNSLSPRIVAEGVRLDHAEAVSSGELVLTYSLLSLRVAEIEAELWEERIRPLIVHNIRRAQEEEARGLFEAEITVNYRYVDSVGHLIAQIDIASRPPLYDIASSN